MKNIKKNFIKKYKNLKEWKKERQVLKKRRKNITLKKMLQLACRTAMSLAVASIGTFVGNALYESIMELREERK